MGYSLYHSLMMKMKLILLATLASLALGAIPLSRQSPDGDDYIPDDRAIGIFTTGNYWGEFTDGNKDLLEAYNLNDKKMVKDDDVKPTSETIEWTQTSKCFWGCSKEYLLVDYYQDGDKSNPVMKVYVATEWGNPPSEFSTSGHEGSLFFGYLNFDDNQAIFFVIHPSDWYPYQHRFKTNSFTSFFNAGISKAASAAGSAAAGWAAGAVMGSIVPVAGTVVGGIVGVAISQFSDDLFGDYMRYIG